MTNVIVVSEKEMALVFDRWAAAVAANPSEFEDVLGDDGNPCEGYGKAAPKNLSKSSMR